MIWNTEKQQILTFEKLEPENVWLSSLKDDLNDYSITKIVAD